MALRKILTDGEPALKKTSRVITEFDDRLHILLDDMTETLKNANGVGLAAPQVGVLRRAVVIDDEENERILELINPEIISTDGLQDGAEGCLSVPGVYGMVERPQTVKLKAKDRFGKEFEIEGEGLLARAFCHETDHLDGKMFTGLVSKFLKKEDIAQDAGESEKSGK